MNRERFSLMKNTAILINTARGEIVDNDALLWALKSGEIKAAGLETLAPEPVTINNTIVAAMKSDSELANKITLSPHIGGLTYQTFTQIYANIWENFKAVENGQRPKNVVN
jgi:lactate dehydrogenase-like 2-hydroxyacid dehydrogenase